MKPPPPDTIDTPPACDDLKPPPLERSVIPEQPLNIKEPPPNAVEDHGESDSELPAVDETATTKEES
jgi:hypothetical protein